MVKGMNRVFITRPTLDQCANQLFVTAPVKRLNNQNMRFGGRHYFGQLEKCDRWEKYFIWNINIDKSVNLINKNKIK